MKSEFTILYHNKDKNQVVSVASQKWKKAVPLAGKVMANRPVRMFPWPIIISDNDEYWRVHSPLNFMMHVEVSAAIITRNKYC